MFGFGDGLGLCCRVGFGPGLGNVSVCVIQGSRQGKSYTAPGWGYDVGIGYWGGVML